MTEGAVVVRLLSELRQFSALLMPALDRPARQAGCPQPGADMINPVSPECRTSPALRARPGRLGRARRLGRRLDIVGAPGDLAAAPGDLAARVEPADVAVLRVF